jgi:transcriptional regulator NrdR family protein
MNCPHCDGKRLAIYDSRHTQYDVIRKRRCLSCEFRFFTLERYMTEEEFDDARSESKTTSKENAG